MIVNSTKNTLLAKDHKEAKNFTAKLTGLIGKDPIYPLLLKTRFGIHSFLIKNPIDVLVMDAEFTVKRISTLNINRIFLYNPKYANILELPGGTILRSKTQIGDKIKIT